MYISDFHMYVGTWVVAYRVSQTCAEMFCSFSPSYYFFSWKVVIYFTLTNYNFVRVGPQWDKMKCLQKIRRLTQWEPHDHVGGLGRFGNHEPAFVDGLVVEGQPGQAGQGRPLLDIHFRAGFADKVIGQAL
jgi:hypothetical protein